MPTKSSANKSKAAEKTPGKTKGARQLSYGRKREQILDGALRVFLQYGYSGTSMDRVTAECGVSKRTIYSHFDDKERLFQALVVHLTGILFPVDKGFPSQQMKPAVYLTKLANAFLERADHWEYTAFFRLVVAESARFPEIAQAYVEEAIKPGTDSLMEYFRSHPELKIKDAQAAARIFRGSLISYVLADEILQARRIMPLPRERFVKALVEMIVP